MGNVEQQRQQQQQNTSTGNGIVLFFQFHLYELNKNQYQNKQCKNVLLLELHRTVWLFSNLHRSLEFNCFALLMITKSILDAHETRGNRQITEPDK